MGSIWNEQVDGALIKLIKRIVKNYDEKGVLEIPSVGVRNPETDFHITKFPSVSIHNYDQKQAKDRIQQGDILSEIDDEGYALMERPALSYNLYYQIDFWANYHDDINEMTRRWLANVEPKTTLEVIDTKDNTRHCNMSLVDYATSDEVVNGEKLFHRIYSYKIWVELDERDPIRVKVATEGVELGGK